jgi:threonine/homoserine/homoserine lactone efflux protein
VIAWRRRARAADPHGDSPARGLATGVLLTLPNPATLAMWVAVAAALWPHAEPAEAALIGAGVGAGATLWFTMLARRIARLAPDHPVIAWIPRIALVVLIAIAAAGVVRALG